MKKLLMLLIFTGMQSCAITLDDVRGPEELADDLYNMVNDQQLHQDLLDVGIDTARRTGEALNKYCQSREGEAQNLCKEMAFLLSAIWKSKGNLNPEFDQKIDAIFLALSKKESKHRREMIERHGESLEQAAKRGVDAFLKGLDPEVTLKADEGSERLEKGQPESAVDKENFIPKVNDGEQSSN